MASENFPSFSVIVPVYNGQTIIQRCIESVLQQTYTLYELIIIDDGSTDDTEMICTAFADKDERIRYCKQANGGVSAARNKGLELAQMDCVLFVDADDYLLPGYVQGFYDRMVNEQINKTVFVLQDYSTQVSYADGKKEEFRWCNFAYGKYSLSQAFENLNVQNWWYWGMPFSKLYWLSVIRKHNISFNKVIQGREDLVFMLDYVQYADTLIMDPLVNYCYIIDKTKESVSSVMTSFSNESAFFNSMKQFADYYADRFALSQEVRQEMNRFVYTSFSRCINSCLYLYKHPTPKATRVAQIRQLATPENLDRFVQSGAADSKIKRLSVILLKMRLFYLFDTINQLRTKRS